MRFDAPDQVVIDHCAVFDAETRILARSLAREALVDAQDDVDGRVSVGMRADVPAGGVGLARILI